MSQGIGFWHLLLHSFRNLLPIVVVVGVFQFAVIQEVPAGLLSMVLRLVIVAFGVALFLQGRSMAAQLITLDAIAWVYLFAFAIGFETTMAEPALVAIGQQAEEAGKGKLRRSRYACW